MNRHLRQRRHRRTSTTKCSAKAVRRVCRWPSYLRQPIAGALGEPRSSFNAGRASRRQRVPGAERRCSSSCRARRAAAGGLRSGRSGAASFDIGVEQGFAGGAGADARRAISTTHSTICSSTSAGRELCAAGVPADVANADAVRRLRQLAVVRRAGAGAVGRGGGRRGRSAHGVVHVSRRRSDARRSAPAAGDQSRQFPGVPIGAFSPLVGSGRSVVRRTRARFRSAMRSGRSSSRCRRYFAGKRDDSTFLSDEFFGNSLLLPNQDLDRGVSEGGSQRPPTASTRGSRPENCARCR